MTTTGAMRSAARRSVIVQVLVVGIVAVALARLTSISERYPYYFAWDMDHAVQLDTLLINSGLLPDHLGHPGFGMNLLLSASERTARAMGSLSAATLSDLQASLNPIGAVAERADYLRRHTPFVCIAIVVMLWAAIQLQFQLSGGYALLFLLVLISQETWTYHASMIRTEVYAIFFWGAATLAAALGGPARRPLIQDLTHVAVGVLLGLSFLTKVQGLFYVGATLCVVALFQSLSDGDVAVAPQSNRLRRTAWTAISALNVLFFIALAFASVRTHIPSGVATFAVNQGITPVAITAGAGLAGLLLVNVFLLRGGPRMLDSERYTAPLTAIAAGFFLAFAFHFLIITDPSVSWLYLVYDFKMLFVRQTFYVATPSLVLSTFASFAAHEPWLFLTHLTLLAVIVAGYRTGILRLQGAQVGSCVAASLIALLNVGLGARFVLRDLIWVETVLNFLSLVYLALIVTHAVRFRRRLITVGVMMLTALVISNVRASSAMTARVAANYNHYGWQPERWAAEMFGFNQPRYTAIIEQAYDKASLRTALRNGVNHRMIRDTASFVFPSQSPNHRNIGIAGLNNPVWARALRYRIASLPDSLAGAIVVDPSSIPNTGRPLFQEAQVRRESEQLEKFKTSASTELLPVLTRPDLRILVFVHETDVASFQGPLVIPTGERITLRIGSDTMEMTGLEVTNYAELPFSDRPGQ